jgi:hypothetical protein
MFPQPPTTTENDDFDEFIKENINLVDFWVAFRLSGWNLWLLCYLASN